MSQPVVAAAPFCAACTAETTNKSAGGAFRLNGCGIGFSGGTSQCPVCGSVKKGRWVSFLWIPIVPLDRYRMIYTHTGVFSSQYYSRRLRDRGTHPVYGILLGVLGVLFLVAAMQLFISSGAAPAITDLVIGVLLILGSIRLVIDVRRQGRNKH